VQPRAHSVGATAHFHVSMVTLTFVLMPSALGVAHNLAEVKLGILIDDDPAILRGRDRIEHDDAGS